MNDDGPPTSCLGVFDSGVGGLSILDALRRRLPDAPLIYVGDVAHAPYGERDPGAVVERCHCIVAYLARAGARTIVVACNTATVLAIGVLRERWPAIQFVGVEPGVKPAAAQSATRRIAVMTTPATARSARLRQLIDEFAVGVHVHVQPCPGLAAMIETGLVDGPALDVLLSPLCERIRAAEVDIVALGCTHYGFAAESIRRLLGGGHCLIDTAAAIAERVADVWRMPHPAVGGLRVLSTGSTAAMTTLLRRCRHVGAVHVLHAPI